MLYKGAFICLWCWKVAREEKWERESEAGSQAVNYHPVSAPLMLSTLGENFSTSGEGSSSHST